MKLIRIFFEKKDEAAYISHLDLQRVMARALRRSGLPVWYSQGFNPHIYMSFALPLPLLHHSLVEAVDCKTESALEDLSEFLPGLNAALPRGIRATRIAAPVYTANDIEYARYRITWPDADSTEAAIAAYNKEEAAMVVRRTKRSETEVDLKEYLPGLKAEAPGVIFVKLPAGGTLNYSPELLLGHIEAIGGPAAASAEVLRIAVLTKDGRPFE